jgi:signal transduction histidine kinase
VEEQFFQCLPRGELARGGPRSTGRRSDALSTLMRMEISGYEPHRGNGAPIAAKPTPVVDAGLLAANADLRRQLSTLEQRIERLLAADDSKDRFLAMVSHELRTPLAAMLPWAHALSTGLLDREHTRRAVQVIERNTRLQARLIDDLLDVSRMIAGTVRLSKTPINLVPILEIAIHSVGPEAAAKGVDLESTLAGEVGVIVADGVRIEQMVMNLIANALRFTPRGGRITITLRSIAGGAEIAVSDTGAGIDSVFLPYVFDAFRQGTELKTNGHGGLGLGLAIVRHLAELHGGIARAESAGQGRGSTFTVSLPCAV